MLNSQKQITKYATHNWYWLHELLPSIRKNTTSAILVVPDQLPSTSQQQITCNKTTAAATTTAPPPPPTTTTTTTTNTNTNTNIFSFCLATFQHKSSLGQTPKAEPFRKGVHATVVTASHCTHALASCCSCCVLPALC